MKTPKQIIANLRDRAEAESRRDEREADMMAETLREVAERLKKKKSEPKR